jgi:hypothetical protein
MHARSGHSRQRRAATGETASALVLAMLIAPWLQPVPAQAHTPMFVYGKGKDGNACTQSAPCLPLQMSLARTAPSAQRYAIDSDNHDDVAINEAVSIIAGRDGTGVLATSSEIGITKNAGRNDIINLQELKVDSAGSGANGIPFTWWLGASRGQGIISSDNSSDGNTNGGPTPAASTSSPPPPTATSPVTKNIVTDFGAKCDGVADDARAFAAFNLWARAQIRPIVLTIPSGSTCTFKSYHAVGSYFAKGIKKLIVLGYGATLSDGNGAGIFSLGGVGQYADNGHSARLETVSAGSSTVVLKNSAQHRLFSVGGWALITGYDLQGFWNSPYGFPSNPHYFEYVQIVGKDTNTGVITLVSPLQNTYKSTWPNYNSGNSGQVDNGGPATLYALDPSWDMEVEYQGLTIARPTAQTYANGRRVTYRDVTFTGTGGAIPTQNLWWQVINCTMPNVDMEVDKLVSSIVVTGTTIMNMNFQSSSIDLLTMDSSIITGNLLGTPKKAVISNSKINALYPGAYAYGRSDEFECTNCIIRSVNLGGHIYKGPNDAGVDAYFTMNNGVITIPNGYGAFAANWAVPGTYVVWQDADRTSISMFQVLDVTQDANNTYVQTNQSGGFPHYNRANNGKLFVRTHPAPKITFTNSSAVAPAGTNDGSDAYYLSLAPAGAPLYSYSKRTYNGSVVDFPWWPVWGNLVTLKMNVTKAYSGGERKVTFYPLGRYFWTTKSSDGSLYSYAPIIDLKAVKERVVTPNSVTGSQPGDAVPSAPEAPLWFGDAIQPHMNADITRENPSVWPSVTVEIITDQRVVSP